MRSNLILLGFMGSGKTSTGKVLATRLEFDFVDTDHVLVTDAGCSIPEIFKTRGEKSFREMERGLLDRLISRERQVLATGGGLWMDPENRSRLLENGFCVWLRTGEDQIWKRVKADLPSRPLLSEAKDPQGQIRELLQSRTPLYSQAHQVVETDNKTPEEVAQGIVEILQEHRPFDLPPMSK